MESRWSRLLSREFLGTLVALAFSGVAMLKGMAGFVEWAAFAGGLLGYYQTNKAVKEVKLLK